MLNEKPMLVFVDESGDVGINVHLKGVSRYYVVVAVVVCDEDVKAISRSVNYIRTSMCSGADLKSSRVGNNQAIRSSILESVHDLPFEFFTLVVDKMDIIPSSGLQYRGSFYKYINRMLYDRLIAAYSNIKFYVDGHGTRHFMKGFELYIKKQYRLSLMREVVFNYVESSKSEIVQLADFISGSINRVLGGKDPEELIASIREKEVLRYEWPLMKYFSENAEGATNSGHDTLVRFHAGRHAELFIEQNVESTDEKIVAQVHLVDFLLKNMRSGKDDYVFGDELLSYLHSCGCSDLTMHGLRANVIAELRDAGVIIASSGKGYKLPSNTTDMHSYGVTVQSKVVPYVSRLLEARNALIAASHGDYDILSSAALDPLRKYMGIA